MVNMKDIREYAKAIVRQFNPERVVLFGSYAEGRPNENSDVDLLVVMPHEGRDVQQAFEIRRSIPRTFPLDLVVRTPEGVEHRLRHNDTFLTSIWRKGKTLYERGVERVDL